VTDIELSIVDTFTDKVFHGQPVAVGFLQEDINDELLHAIALENNYPETIFFQYRNDAWLVRSFNAQGEVYSNGNGILAAAHNYFHLQKNKPNVLEFKTVIGYSKLIYKKDKIYLEYPYIQVQPGKVPENYYENFSIRPLEILQNGPDVIAFFENQQQVEQCQIQILAFKNLISGALILTAKGEEADIYCRCFTPRVSIQEETATPSIYSRLFHWWSQRLGHKTQMRFVQGLMRRSEIEAFVQDTKLWVGGACRCYFKGKLLL
jgi:PhzF family phenazine biosynthesis protein